VRARQQLLVAALGLSSFCLLSWLPPAACAGTAGRAGLEACNHGGVLLTTVQQLLLAGVPALGVALFEQSLWSSFLAEKQLLGKLA
jgi:hypothetical protein